MATNIHNGCYSDERAKHMQWLSGATRESEKERERSVKWMGNSKKQLNIKIQTDLIQPGDEGMQPSLCRGYTRERARKSQVIGQHVASNLEQSHPLLPGAFI